MAIRFTITDYSGENSTFSLPLPNPTAVNFNADFEVGGAGAYDDLLAAVQAVTIGNVSSVRADAFDRSPEPGNPANPFAQVELGLRLTMQDASGNNMSRTLGAPDLATIAQAGSDVVPLANIAALVAAIEEHVIGLDGGNVTVTGAVIVGRRA